MYIVDFELFIRSKNIKFKSPYVQLVRKFRQNS